MALSKFGYTGTVNQDQWADIMGLSGVSYAVRTLADWLVSAVGGVRSVSIAAGQGVGFGVLVATDTPTVIPLAPPSAGRWDLITMRRDWSTPANTGFVVTPHETLTGATAPSKPPATYPASLGNNINNGLGNVGTGVDHQPIAWVWHNNLSVVPLIIDLRTLPLDRRLATEVGLVPITPRSVGGAGTSLEPDGSISFVNTTYFFVNECFDGRFRDYQLELDIGGTTGGTQNAQVGMNFRVAGVDDTPANYASGAILAVGGVLSSPASSNPFMLIAPQPAYAHRSRLLIARPALAGQPSVSGTVHSMTAGGAQAIVQVGSVEISPVVARDGFSIVLLTGGMTVSGRARIYGLR